MMRTAPAVALLLVAAACGGGSAVYRASGTAPRGAPESLESRLEARARALGYTVYAPADVSRSGPFVYAEKDRGCGAPDAGCDRRDLLIVRPRQVRGRALASRWKVDVWAWTLERSASPAGYGAIPATPEVRADADAMVIRP